MSNRPSKTRLDDLLEWLRVETGYRPDDQYQREAADLIERFVAALQKIVARPGLQNLSFSCDAQVMVDWAREALAEQPVETKAE